jgi:beta-lactamase class D
MVGWFVDYGETHGNVYFFACNIEGSTYQEIREKRINVTKRILVELGYLPEEGAGK